MNASCLVTGVLVRVSVHARACWCMYACVCECIRPCVCVCVCEVVVVVVVVEELLQMLLKYV